MKVLVTGAMGFIGSNLVPFLLNEGHEVIGFDNLFNPSIDPTDRMKKNSGDNWSRFKFYNADIRNTQHMLSIAINEQPEVVIHLAAIGSVPRSFAYPSMVCDVNERGFVNMMELCAALKIKKFIFASSSSVYGHTDSPVRTEGEEGVLTSPYALSKKANEEFARIWGSYMKIPWIGLRFFNVYGPGQLVENSYAAVIPKFINNKKPVVNGNGQTVRDFTFVGDVCSAIINCMMSSVNNQIFNVGTGVGCTLNNLLDILGIKDASYVQERLGDVKSSISNPHKIADMIGWKAQTSIEEGLLKTAKYYKALKTPSLEQIERSHG